jgi:hypothetical protein
VDSIQGPVKGSCEHANGLSGSILFWEFLLYLKTYTCFYTQLDDKWMHIYQSEKKIFRTIVVERNTTHFPANRTVLKLIKQNGVYAIRALTDRFFNNDLFLWKIIEVSFEHHVTYLGQKSNSPKGFRVQV